MATIVVHGTFARDADWWHPARSQRFLEALSQGMQQGGRQPDVWSIGGRSVMQWKQLQTRATRNWLGVRRPPPYEVDQGCFRWSGRNFHGERLAGGQSLARYLDALSQINPQEPINIVAHSHGCNVVKVATQHVSPAPRLGRVVFLAAPHMVRAADASEFPYRLDAGRLRHMAGADAVVLNLYSEEDSVQTTVADTVTSDIPGATGTWLDPVVNAFRTEQDPAAQPLYENLAIPTRLGSGTTAHGAMHGATIGWLAGFWLGSWPDRSADQCWRRLQLPALTDPDSG